MAKRNLFKVPTQRSDVKYAGKCPIVMNNYYIKHKKENYVGIYFLKIKICFIINQNCLFSNNIDE